MSQRSRTMMMAALVVGASISSMMSSGADAKEISPKAVADLSRYCTTCWRNARVPPDAWEDCTQEVLCRLLGTVPAKSWEDLLKGEGEERQEFLRAIDAVKKRQQRAKKHGELPLDVADYRQPINSKSDLKTDFDPERVSRLAEEKLSPRQQKILQLVVEGWNVHAIAGEMNMPEARVSDEKYKAIRKLQKHLRADVA